ncbi:DUF4139 domain-containing protein [Luteolibacter algae]|uniref:DUF4139 domain-containing protein n=1 Tax=Luteolibacter algae TaxID=454151 RepID=A0ABW5D9X4_9BACT
MKPTLLLLSLTAVSQADTAITIYNQNLATIRESIGLTLGEGISSATFENATSQVMPDSVVLRDPSGEHQFSILEQSYRNDPVSPELLLSLNEGKTIDFRALYPDGKVEIIPGKIIRSGYVPNGQAQSPIIEVDGKIRFSLPGEPLFPSLGTDSVLKPTLSWQIHSREKAEFPAQLSYLSHGMSWQATYNLVAPEEGETVTLTGWITVENNSGTTFTDATVKLVAGDVNMQPKPEQLRLRKMESFALSDSSPGEVSQKAFDDFHLYSLPRPLTLHDKETKQVEFLRSPEVTAVKNYIYDPISMYRFQGGSGIQTQPIEGQQFPKDVAIYWEFKNSEENGLGMPLPAGNMRFYREDSDDSNLEFVGENSIDHTPKNETVRVYTGNAFDLVGERKITDYQLNERQKWIRESVTLTLKNRSELPKTITVREPLWRGTNWNIENPSHEFEKTDSNTIEFTVDLAPDEEKDVTFTSHYSW